MNCKKDRREKLTVEDIEWLISNYVDSLKLYHDALETGFAPIMEKETLMRLNKNYLMREIKYLISLQEK